MEGDPKDDGCAAGKGQPAQREADRLLLQGFLPKGKMIRKPNASDCTGRRFTQSEELLGDESMINIQRAQQTAK